MKSAHEITACVIDHGLFLPTAVKLGEQFLKTYYWTPTEKSFPTLRDAVIGDGYDRLERVLDFWRIKDKCDLFVFPDIGFAGLQHELRSQGFPVWGGGSGDRLETKRGLFLDTLKELGMEVPPWKPILGLEELRAHLRPEKDKWVKISRWRGDCETFHWQDWESSRDLLDSLAVRFGPLQDEVAFYVLDPIETDLEDGVDTYCIAGQLPAVCLHAMERKDKALLGTIANFADIAEPVRQVSERFSQALKQFDYRQFFSTEVRIQGDKVFFIDPTLRCASPVSQLQTELYSNLGEIIWQGANGNCIDPEPTAQFGVQVALEVKRESGDWAFVKIPDSIEQWVKCGFSAKVNGAIAIPPNDWMRDEFGWLVATGNTIEEAVENAKHHAEELPHEVTCDVTALAFLIDEVHKAEREGVEFTDQPVPKPEIAVP